MLTRLIMFCLLMASALPAASQSVPPAPVRVAIETSEGRIVVEVDREHAPITAGNFLRYVDQKRLDGAVFYRTVKVQEKFGFVQFGVQGAANRVLPPIKHEPTTQTGIKHLDGTISTARLAPGTARGEFTIMVSDQPSLDADPSAPGDNQGYAAFGRVVEGMEVVHEILDKPTSNAGSGVMKGQMIASPIKIASARRLP